MLRIEHRVWALGRIGRWAIVVGIGMLALFWLAAARALVRPLGGWIASAVRVVAVGRVLVPISLVLVAAGALAVIGAHRWDARNDRRLLSVIPARPPVAPEPGRGTLGEPGLSPARRPTRQALGRRLGHLGEAVPDHRRPLRVVGCERGAERGLDRTCFRPAWVGVRVQPRVGPQRVRDLDDVDGPPLDRDARDLGARRPTRRARRARRRSRRPTPTSPRSGTV